ncbi:MAG: hypothetical protein U9O24_00660 [Campylobacterota bacterium]|nr:hypothetical protein [Campylobacterota bacterium]
MKKLKILWLVFLLLTIVNAENTTLKIGYENLNFDNSKKKDKGKVYSVSVEHKTVDSLYQIAYERTNTNTFKPPLTEDLHVDKYYLKYTSVLNEKEQFSISYATINDNLMKETDGGNIYGLGYKYRNFSLTQYLSDYSHFDVYQTDIKYKFKKSFGQLHTSIILLGKYIYLNDRESNNFSKNANQSYFTPGVKLHAHYQEYHFGLGAFFGKRVFAVMNDGFKVQHHAMEFNKTYMFGVGRHFENIDINLKYIYQNATEIPISNRNVKVQNIGLIMRYSF